MTEAARIILALELGWLAGLSCAIWFAHRRCMAVEGKVDRLVALLKVPQ